MAEQVWFGVDAVQARFGGLIGRDKILALMKAQHIKSRIVGRAFATTEAYLEDFESLILEAEEPIEFKDSLGNVILIVSPLDLTHANLTRTTHKKGTTGRQSRRAVRST